jgi:ATP-dependent RNA helicase RhlE
LHDISASKAEVLTLPLMTFDELDLEEDVLDGLWAMNFRECTPVQEQAIPILLGGKDLIACAQTGTGKTAAYLLPILNHLVQSEHPEDAINAIIMVPTRELAQQIDQQVAGFAYYLPVSSVAVYGGSDGIVWEQQKKGLQAGVDIVIATPGRLLSYLKLGLIDISQVQYFILDEADRMLDMGFFEDIMQVVNELPRRRQTMLFSATMPGKIRELAKTILNEPSEIRLAVSKPNDKIMQSAYICYERQKAYLVKQLFMETLPDKVLIFASSKIKVKEVTRTLRGMNLSVAEMHSDLDQSERDSTMYAFKNGKVNILIATDIVSRGIDIEDISVVINYDVPHDAEDYVHRIGRTARASAEGLAITFVSEDEQELFERIEKFLGKTIYRMPLPEEVGEGPEFDPAKHHSSGGRFGKGRSFHGKKRN